MNPLRILFFLISLVGCCAGHYAFAADPARTVIVPKSSSTDINHEDYYFSHLLVLALDKTRGSHGDYRLREHPVFMVDDRLRQALKRGNLDVIWSVTHPDYECEMLPVKIPLLKDLNNYRVLLIRGNDQSRFSRVKSLDDLRKLTGGLGSQWSDVEVMKANRLPLVTAPGYGKLFKMLAAGRFDYFSRGLYQVQTEVNFYPELNLAIENTLMLHYPNDVYFFVSRKNASLAERLQLGLRLALADGSFDALFESIPRYQWALRELARGGRRIIPLERIVPLEKSPDVLSAPACPRQSHTGKQTTAIPTAPCCDNLTPR